MSEPEIELQSFDDFPIAIANLRSNYGEHEITLSNGSIAKIENAIYFRGQADALWNVESTLERTIRGEKMDLSMYMLRALSVVNWIETITSRSWDLPDFPTVSKAISDDTNLIHFHVPCPEYLSYLRHHGFPSPLVDWSISPYVATFFALERKVDAERAAVFAYIGSTKGGLRSASGGDAIIRSLGPYMTTTPRHFAQKSRYTIAAQGRDRMLCSHHEATGKTSNSTQDVLIKLTFPTSERRKILKRLDDDYNINAYTLYGSEDSAVQLAGMQVFDTMI